MTADLLDSFLPAYDTREYHDMPVASSPRQAYAAMRAMNLARSPIVLALLAIRGIPHFLTGKAAPSRVITIDSLLELGFVILAEDDSEIVLGTVGRFWRLDSGLHRVAAVEFAGFDEPGYANAVMNFKVHEEPSGSVLISTETRVVGTDEDARRKFLRYWRLIGPFSAFIRTRLLNAIKRDAEAAAAA